MTAPNAELAYAVLDQIDAHPELWDQGAWIGEGQCGTVGCFAGWAVLLSGGQVDPETKQVSGIPGLVGARWVWDTADALLGISTIYLNRRGLPDPYDGLHSRKSLGEAIAEIFGPRPAHCGYPLPHPAHDWTLLANDERPADQAARCEGVADDGALPDGGSTS